MTALSPADQERLSVITDKIYAAVLSGELLPDCPVIVTPITEPVAPEHGALVYWDATAGEGVVIQRLLSDQDRDYQKRLMAQRRQMRDIVEEQTTKGSQCNQ